MPVTYGFYNSYNHDRLYSAEQFGMVFDGLIADGVYAKYGKAFQVEPKEGMQVYVQSGRGWFNHTWTLNDGDNSLWFTLDNSDVQYARYDAIVLRVHKTNRINSIEKKTGTPASTPSYPTLTKTDTVIEYPLAYIRVRAGASSISASDITPAVGTAACPYVIGVVSDPQDVTQYIHDFCDALNASLNEWKQETLALIEAEYSASEDDMGYAAAIANVRSDLNDEIEAREALETRIAGDGGAIAQHDANPNAHVEALRGIKSDLGKLRDTTVPALTTKVNNVVSWFADAPPLYDKGWDHLDRPKCTFSRWNLRLDAIGGGRPDRTKMGDFVLVLTLNTNENAKYNVEVAFGLKNYVAMRCKNNNPKWGAWTYAKFLDAKSVK